MSLNSDEFTRAETQPTTGRNMEIEMTAPRGADDVLIDDVQCLDEEEVSKFCFFHLCIFNQYQKEEAINQIAMLHPLCESHLDAVFPWLGYIMC